MNETSSYGPNWRVLGFHSLYIIIVKKKLLSLAVQIESTCMLMSAWLPWPTNRFVTKRGEEKTLFIYNDFQVLIINI